MKQVPAIAILGAGRWGITLAHVAASNGAKVVLWDRDGRRASSLQRRRSSKKLLPELERIHDGVTVTSDASQACDASDTLMLACPAGDVRTILRAAGDAVDGHHAIVHAVRGAEGKSLAFPSRVVRQETCVQKTGALLGPIVVDDLLAGRPNAAVVASRFPSVRESVQAAFASDALRVYTSDDLVGVEVAAAGASVGAIAIGLCLQLELGPATLAAFITRGTAELARVVRAAGGKSDTAFGLAGLGDLVARRESESREVLAGRMLAQGKVAAEIEKELGQLDAVAAATTFAELAANRGIDAHLTKAVGAMLSGKATPQQAIGALMTLPQMHEG